MELIGFLIVGALTFVGVYRMHTRHRPRVSTSLGLTPSDADELDAVAQHLLWERLTQRSAGLATRLRTILTRGVPPRGLTPGRDGDPWTLTFADGGSLAVTAKRQGDLTDMLVSLMRGRAVLVGHAFDGDDLVLEFTAGNRLVHLTAVALA